MRSIFSLLFLLSSFPLLFSQVYTRMPDNAASAALGGAVIAYPAAQSGLFNDALPAVAEQFSVWAGAVRPFNIKGWQAVQAQAVASLGTSGGVGLELQQNGWNDYREQRLRLLYARRLGKDVFLGASVHALRLSVADYGAVNAFSAGLGILARVRPSIWLGAGIQNPLTKPLQSGTMPVQFRLGLCWQLSPLCRLLTECEKLPGRPAQMKTGVEYKPLPPLTFRLGGRSGPARAALGAGWTWKPGISIDFAAEWHTVLGLTPSVQLCWQRKKFP